MNTKLNTIERLSLGGIAVLVVGMLTPFVAQTALASSPAHVMVRLDRMQATTATGGTICVKPTSTSTITSVTVVFPSTAGTDYVVSGTAANWTITTTPTGNWPSGVTTAALGSVATATTANAGTKTVTFPANQTTPSTTTYYCFNFSGTTTLTTSSAAAVPSTYGSVATNADSTPVQYAIAIVANDQIALNATTVPPIFTLSFGANTDGFASNTLSTLTTLLHSTGVTLTAATNASAGWVLWARSSNVGTSNKQSLKSVAASKQIQSASAVNSAAHAYASGTNNGEDYGMSASVAACTVGAASSVDAAYDSTAGTKLGVLADSTGSFFPIAANAGASSGCGVTVKFEAGIGVTTPAANDYTDTLTIVGAGLF
jgi:hypothetical protein